MTNNIAGLVNERSVCDALHISLIRLQELIASGDIPQPKKIAGEWLWSKAWLFSRPEMSEFVFYAHEAQAITLLSSKKQCRRLTEEIKKQAAIEKQCCYHQQKIADIELYLSASRIEYAKIPAPFTSNETELPELSGIYFIWNESGGLAYVGQSVNIKKRMKSHHARLDGDAFSWLLFPEPDLRFAEAFYIGIGKPFRNGNVT